MNPYEVFNDPIKSGLINEDAINKMSLDDLKMVEAIFKKNEPKWTYNNKLRLKPIDSSKPILSFKLWGEHDKWGKGDVDYWGCKPQYQHVGYSAFDVVDKYLYENGYDLKDYYIPKWMVKNHARVIWDEEISYLDKKDERYMPFKYFLEEEEWVLTNNGYTLA